MFFDSRGVVSGHRRDRSHDQSLLPRHGDACEVFRPGLSHGKSERHREESQ